MPMTRLFMHLHLPQLNSRRKSDLTLTQYRKLLQRIAILSRARKYIPAKYRLLLYNASIKPLFTYCCTVWSNCSQTNLDELFKLQKRCARLILDSPRDARSYDNFQKLKWLPVDQLFICLNTSTLPEQKHYTVHRNQEPKQ